VLFRSPSPPTPLPSGERGARQVPESVSMQPTLPFWFRQRQGKLEAVEGDLYRATAPNLNEAFLGIHRGENGCWSAFLRREAKGADLAHTEPRFTSPQDAWDAAFELLRICVVT